MIKPGLVYKSANPCALKGKDKHLLPVYWMHNKKAWMKKGALPWMVPLLHFAGSTKISSG